MAPVPKIVAWVVGLLSAAVLVSAAGGGVLAVLAPRPYWAWLGFEVVVGVACVQGLLFAGGRFRDAPALALACVAGGVFLASLLGRLSVLASVSGLAKDPWTLGRVLAAGLVGGSAAWLVLSRNPRSLGYLVRGVLCGVVPAGAAAYALGPWRGLVPVGSLHPALVWGGGLVLGIVVGGLFCASVHCLIRAFEMGRPSGEGGAAR